MHDESVEVPASPHAVDAVHAALARLWTAAAALPRPPDEGARMRFDLAAVEIATNVIRHAYAGQAPGPLRLRLRATDDRVEALFEDVGAPYVEPERESHVPDAFDDLLDVPEGGFGLALVRSSVDSVDYERTAEGANRWSLVKLL